MPSGDDRPGLYRFAHPAMATTFEVLIAAKSRAYAEAAADAAFSEVDRLERELSRFISDSDIARINRLRAGDAVQVGIDAFECLQLAEAVWRETSGAFDVTVGGWLSGPDRDAAAQEARPVGMSLLELDAQRRRVRVRADGVRVDLGALGKGYAVDQVVEVLVEWSISRGLVHAGQSSVYALGNEGVADPAKTSARRMAHAPARSAESRTHSRGRPASRRLPERLGSRPARRAYSRSAHAAPGPPGVDRRLGRRAVRRNVRRVFHRFHGPFTRRSPGVLSAGERTIRRSRRADGNRARPAVFRLTGSACVTPHLPE
jgi:hypothetical protein